MKKSVRFGRQEINFFQEGKLKPVSPDINLGESVWTWDQMGLADGRTDRQTDIRCCRLRRLRMGSRRTTTVRKEESQFLSIVTCFNLIFTRAGFYPIFSFFVFNRLWFASFSLSLSENGHYTILEPQKLSIVEFYAAQKCKSTDFEPLNFEMLGQVTDIISISPRSLALSLYLMDEILFQTNWVKKQPACLTKQKKRANGRSIVRESGLLY